MNCKKLILFKIKVLFKEQIFICFLSLIIGGQTPNDLNLEPKKVYRKINSLQTIAILPSS